MSKPHSTLVVAGRGADYPGLIDALRVHRAGVPTAFTLLVPATPHGFAWATDMRSGFSDALARAERAAERIRAAGLELEETIVGDPDPFAAVGDVLHSRGFDELVIATLPRGVSSWLKVGLIARLGRITDLPIHRITVEQSQRAEISARQLAAVVS